MRHWLVLLVLLLSAPAAQAGVYNLTEVYPFVSVEDTRNTILRIRSAAVDTGKTPDPDSFRGRLLRQKESLEAIRQAGNLSFVERINLSGCYLRLGLNQEAIRLLLAGDQQHFLVQANLAAGYFLTGELEMAIRHQRQVLALWPTVWAGWTRVQLQHYREAERYLLRLFEMRAREARLALEGGKRESALTVDALFPGLRFVGPDGKYAAGTLSQSMQDLLPPYGFQVVVQLNLWFPTDMRLYWLMGELLNATGQIEQAYAIFNELVDAGLSGRFLDLPAHRRELAQALPIARALSDPQTVGQLLAAGLLIAPPALGGGVAGRAIHATGCSTAAVALPVLSQPQLASGPAEASFMPPAAGTALPFNLQHTVVSFALGVLVAVMLALQWRRASGSQRKNPQNVPPPI
jgi:hypothetical protein